MLSRLQQIWFENYPEIWIPETKSTIEPLSIANRNSRLYFKPSLFYGGVICTLGRLWCNQDVQDHYQYATDDHEYWIWSRMISDDHQYVHNELIVWVELVGSEVATASSPLLRITEQTMHVINHHHHHHRSDHHSHHHVHNKQLILSIIIIIALIIINFIIIIWVNKKSFQGRVVRSARRQQLRRSQAG